MTTVECLKICWMPYINENFILGARGFRFSRTVHTGCRHSQPFYSAASARIISQLLKLISRFHLVQSLRTTGATHLVPPCAVMWYTGTVSHLHLRIRPLELPSLRWGLEMLCSHKERERERSACPKCDMGLCNLAPVTMRHGWILTFFRYWTLFYYQMMHITLKKRRVIKTF